MTISSSSSFNSIYSGNNQNQFPSLEFDKNLAAMANYPSAKDDILNKNQPKNNDDTKINNNNLAAQSDFVDQFAYAPNVSAMFSAYLEKQRLTGSLNSKKDEISQRLVDNGLDKKLALSYAQSSVDMYKQILEAQLNSKIEQQVLQQKEFKQKQMNTNEVNPYLQMMGSYINLYS